ncbi:hypothetical protein [Anaerosporomusa subterranea]|uniref:hypothetical protein n=1 Tax=Anaerosporomusa subterranea TaxID=1794912 RepID=UPI0012E6FFCB|nr:hypothetical protein [Anaerosporomusa subterranea]
MFMRFKPPGKQRFKHYYKRPAMEAAEEWDVSPYAGSSCLDDCSLREILHPYSEKMHIR